jgi:hypothetical protein
LMIQYTLSVVYLRHRVDSSYDFTKPHYAHCMPYALFNTSMPCV